MSRVRIFSPTNRLKDVLPEFGGQSFDELVAASEARLEALGPELRAYVHDQVKAMLAIHDQGEEAMFGLSRELGDLALNIAEVAGAARLEALGEVARGVRAMVDSLISSGVWHSDALDLHISSLVLVTSGDELSEAEVEAMLKRLQVMRARVGVTE